MSTYGRNYKKRVTLDELSSSILEENTDAKTEVLIKRQDEQCFINDFIYGFLMDDPELV